MAAYRPLQRGNSVSDDDTDYVEPLETPEERNARDQSSPLGEVSDPDYSMMINHGDDEMSDDSDGPTARRNIGRREQVLSYISIIGKMFAIIITSERSHCEYDEVGACTNYVLVKVKGLSCTETSKPWLEDINKTKL